jgi:hypothetical protein
MRARTATTGSPLLIALLLAAPGRAQEATRSATALDPDAIRAMLIEGFEQNRRMDIDFARAVTLTDPPSLGDRAVPLNGPGALEWMVAKAYDWVVGGLRALPAPELTERTELFGMTLPRWRLYLFVLTHTYWTRGQLVSYLRLNGAVRSKPPPATA